jgi:hydrogenase expression/formation protein HypE
LSVLENCVFPFVETTDPDVIVGAVFGEDAALTRVGGDILVSHVDPIVGAIGNIGRLAVHVACNDIAACGVPPRWIQLLVLVPSVDDVNLLEQIMRDVSHAAKEIGVSIIGGHTGYSASLSRPLVAVTALGTASGRRPVGTGGARVDDHVLVTKGLAVEGTAILAEDFQDVAEQFGLSAEGRVEAQQLMSSISVVPEALALADHGATAMHDVTRGGLLETLLEIARLSGACIEISAARLPIAPIVARFAQAFQFDPLRMISSGTLAVTVPPERLDEACRALDDLGVSVADIGVVVSGNGVRLMRDGEVTHYTGIYCEEDELARMWKIYPREA